MRIVIAGCGRLGANLARGLARDGHTIAVMDPDPRALARLRSGFSGQRLEGSPLDREVLLQAGIERADALAAVFEAEATNVAVALAARRIFRVPRVVARLHLTRLADLVHRLGILPLCPLAWGVRRFADLLCRSTLETVATLGGQVDLVEIHLPPALAGKAVEDLTVCGELQVVSVTRAGRTWLAEPGLRLEEGDHVHLAARGPGKARLRSLLSLP